MKLYHLLFSLFIMILVNCTTTDTDSQLENALIMAGENRTELEEVLRYYADDSLKLEAAKFLIRNMPGHYSYADTTVIIKYSHAVDSLLEAMKDSNFVSIRDSINSCAKHFKIATLKKIQDIKVIQSSYLKKNIDAAFYSWRKDLWAQHLSFDDFCEYLLPYKIEELQLLDDWRLRMKNFHSEKLSELNRCDIYRNSTLEASRTLIGSYKDFMNPHIDDAVLYPTMKWETRAKISFGTCDYYSSISLILLRSNGIPVSSDFTPHWGCRRLGHSWNVLMAENGHKYPFDAMSSFPGDSYRLSEKLAKAYRRTYAINEELVELNKSEKYIPLLFKTLFIKDVTRDYISSEDVTIKVSSSSKHKDFAFLSIFGDRDWTPISFGKVKGDKVHYNALGKNILYLPFCYNDSGKINYIGSPFVVLPTGKIRKIEANKRNKIQMVLKRKYPTLENVYRLLNRLDSCEFQASNDITFNNHQLIHKIGQSYGIGYNIKLPDSVPAYRYWRFLSTKPETHANIAELYFFDHSGKEIKGKIIGTEGSWGDRQAYTREAAFDGNILTFFDAPDGDSTWVGVDFGRPVKIRNFYYYGRGDGNAIEPYNKYELFYWDYDKWNSLGIKKASSPTLHYDNVPSGGVYLLRNITKGQEERIFTYENGEQIWW